MQVRGSGLRPGLGGHGEHDRALAGFGDMGLPLSIPAVEEKDPLPGFKPQHMGQVMPLRPVKRDRRPCRKRSFEVKAQAFEVVRRHLLPILGPIRPAVNALEHDPEKWKPVSRHREAGFGVGNRLR